METSLKEYLNGKPNAKTCIIDNNFLDFCTRLKEKDVSIISLLKQYDVIIIPSWVNVEINDSSIRPAYLQELRANEIYVYIIEETEYIDLANDEELNILYITMYSAHRFSQIDSFIKKSIIQNQPYEDIEYEFTDWIKMLYNNWPLSGNEVGQIDNRRIQKKNAGEISISILAHILSYYFPKLESITLLTFDKDCYNCIYYAQDKFNKNDNFKNRDYASITFKSNDLILYELVKNKYYTIEHIKRIIDNIRTPRNIKFSRRKEDNSFEEKFGAVDNSTLIDIICDDSLHIIF
jgi:hypothetical protein